ncbi:response regulator [Alkalilimnicola ehrlichii MLHE-1]|uniref:Response regulator receiver protein n=1 Tax=Alkalilimnicola ehrlichii (strain ATCC BAA-1101 / DSM 17681 / MLHE-1) TaxID=187272 RepID=Q0A7P0_ALKEH|nr:response regulator [Alkalilimnicola ehrlichii]ABI57147.1 response regulator receiver protein [Alkalilimnicola ehrlichii MLHE-1]
MTTPSLPDRVLIVDDFQPMRSLLNTMLRQMGFENIDQAHNGRSALESFRGRKQPLVFLDISMPDMTGLEVLRELRELEGGDQAFVIMQTGDATRDNVLEAKELGVGGFIAKPYNMQKVKALVGVYLKRDR